MDKRKWPWKKKSSEPSPGESESSRSFSSHSERYSDEQEALRESPNDNSQSPEVTSKATSMDDEVKETVKSLTEKLSAALVNVSAKEDLVKQHAKVAEEAVAGWEKAENEVASLKQQLEAALQQNVNLEVRTSHLDGALKECVRQLRQLKDEHEKRVSDALLEKKTEWESVKSDLEKQILNLQSENQKKPDPVVDPDTLLILESLENENSTLKQELACRFRELEILMIERDLSTQAAENASKLQLESIKKIAKLESECRRLQSISRKSTPVRVSPLYAESLTDSCKSSNTGSDQNFSEPDQFKNLTVEIDMMDDFLEMEKLATLSEPDRESGSADNNPWRAELDSMTQRVKDLESELKRIENEKLELMSALEENQSKMAEGEIRLGEMKKKLMAVNETKELLESKLDGMEVENRTLSANIESLKGEIEEERKLSAGLSAKCRDLENELTRRIEETEIELDTNLNVEPKIKQEDLAVAADKLAECQKTIASLGRQLESLATLEDFLIDTSSIPGFSKVSGNGGDIWTRLPSRDRPLAKCDPDRPRMSMENHHSNVVNGDEGSLQLSLANHVTGGAKSRNGFGKFFSRSKSVLLPRPPPRRRASELSRTPRDQRVICTLCTPGAALQHLPRLLLQSFDEK
ncbi:filament-like plant protein [Phtheirospermum japonicum]|uniref:Filament-like plant protein n=1 Tax=Phtheirospermum japonicum TaxID=374723 RepID=A0A830BK75_9LAMI|nr:filament-like plant protein [Phtheirospermum japonicum]